MSRWVLWIPSNSFSLISQAVCCLSGFNLIIFVIYTMSTWKTTHTLHWQRHNHLYLLMYLSSTMLWTPWHSLRLRNLSCIAILIDWIKAFFSPSRRWEDLCAKIETALLSSVQTFKCQRFHKRFTVKQMFARQRWGNGVALKVLLRKLGSLRLRRSVGEIM